MAFIYGMTAGTPTGFYRTGDRLFTVRLPGGRYMIDAGIDERATTEGTTLVVPSIVLDRDTALDLDARTAKPIKITVPKRDARTLVAGVVRKSNSDEGGSFVLTGALHSMECY